MKKVLIIILLSIIPVMGYDFKKLVIGKWGVVRMEGDSNFGQMIFDKTTCVLIESSGMESQEYQIKNNQLCFKNNNKYVCDKMVWASEDEFYLMNDKLKFVRIK